MLTSWPLVLLSLAASQDTSEGSAALEGSVRAMNVRTAGAVVYLIPLDGGPVPPPIDTALIDQRDLRFVPRTLVVPPGAVVQFRNSDPILHNVFSPPGVAEGFDLGTYPRGEGRPHGFTAPGTYVILCHVHPEMVAFVVVVPTTYYAVVDEDNRFRVDKLRPGRYQLRVWHWRTATLDRVVTLHRGSQQVELELTSARKRR